MTQLRFVFFLLTLGAVMGAVGAQTAPVPPGSAGPGQGQPVEIDFAEVYERIVTGDTIYQRLAGEVELRRGDLFIYCDEATIRNDDFVRARGQVVLLQNDTLSIFADSMRYYVSQDIALLFGHVVLVNGAQQLFTDALRYDLAAKRATYTTRAKLTDGDAQLSSLRGVYDVGLKRATFRDSVFVVGDNFNLISDTLSFATDQRIVYFEGPTVMATNNSRVYCEDGYYNLMDSTGEFRRRAQVARGEERYIADVITFDAQSNQFELSGNAAFVAAERRARGDTIRYNERTNRTYLAGSATFIDGEQRVDGERIDYDGTTKTFTSRGRVNISEPPYLLLADSVSFDDSAGLAFVHGAVTWRDTAAQRMIVAEDIIYRRDGDYVKAFGGRPIFSTVLEGDSLHIAADTLYSFREPYRSPVAAPASQSDTLFADSSFVTGSSLVTDSSRVLPTIKLSVDTLLSTKSDPSSTAPTDTLLAIRKDPELPNEERVIAQLPTKPSAAPTLPERTALPLLDSAANGLRREALAPLAVDSSALDMASDTTASASALPDSVRRVLAYHNVRIYKSNLQAICDSLAMNSLDSTITLFQAPVVWSDTSQFIADTIAIKLRGEEVEHVYLRSRALIVNSPDERFFNQVKGRRVDVDFAAGEINRMLVRGNAESVYYILDEAGAYIGVNHVRAARMRLDFEIGELSDIRLYEQIEGGIEPIAPNDQPPKLLEDFRWETELRPRSKADLP